MGQREYTRSQRIASQLREELSELIRIELKDSRLSWVTVDEVEVSRDLQVAKVYVSSLKEEQLEESLKALKAAAPFLRHELGKRLHVRVVPELRFYRDTAIEHGLKITQLLRQIKNDADES
ncbi:MAG: 30S ribosome-binding factor RbfA [Methylohalobius sp.]|nr:30S ribosome-binding factor RbfA [Methylohalobius sp.]